MNMMLDWLKFLPFSIEQDSSNKPTEIHGPYFSKLKKNKWMFGDTTFYFSAPRSNPVFSFDGSGAKVDSVKPGRRDILKNQLWDRVYNNSAGPENFWIQELFYENTWYFVGPWFSGKKSRLIVRSLLVSTSDSSDFRQSSLLHPRGFEAACSDYLDHAFGYQRSGKRPHYRGPLNWRKLPLSETIQAALYDLHYIANGNKPALTRVVSFPVTAQQFVIIYFNLLAVDLDDEVISKPTLALCDSIIDSMRLEVGKSTQAEWDKVKQTCPDMALSETMGEFQWPLFKEEPNKKPTEKEILQAEETQKIPFKS